MKFKKLLAYTEREDVFRELNRLNSNIKRLTSMLHNPGLIVDPEELFKKLDKINSSIEWSMLFFEPNSDINWKKYK